MSDITVLVQETDTTVTVSTTGPQGAAGPQGIQGVQGPSGSFSGNIAYTHTQSVASATWEIVHNLAFFPNVTVQDSAGTIVEGEISYTSSNALTLTFSGAFSGVAYLS